MHNVCESHHELFLLMTQGGSGPLIAGLAHLWVGPYLIFVVGDKYEVGSGQNSDNLCQKLIAWMNGHQQHHPHELLMLKENSRHQGYLKKINDTLEIDEW